MTTKVKIKFSVLLSALAGMSALGLAIPSKNSLEYYGYNSLCIAGICAEIYCIIRLWLPRK